MLADVEDRDGAGRVREPRDRERLPGEAAPDCVVVGKAVREQLHGDDPCQVGVLGPVDLAHPPARDPLWVPVALRNPERSRAAGRGLPGRGKVAWPRMVPAREAALGPLCRQRRTGPLHPGGARGIARLSHAASTVTIFDVGERDGRPYMRDGVPPRRVARPISSSGKAPGGSGGGCVARPDGDHPSQHQAREPLAGQRRPRPKVADFGVASAADLGSFTEAGAVRRHRRLLRARSRLRRAGSPFERPLRPGGRRLRTADGRAAVRARGSTAEAMAHVSAPIPARPRGRTRSCRPRLDDVLARGLAKEPEHRYASASDFVEGLARRPPRSRERRARARSRPAESPPERRGVPLLLLLLGGALLAGILAAALLARDDGAARDGGHDGAAAGGRGSRCRRRSPSRGARTPTVTTAPSPRRPSARGQPPRRKSRRRPGVLRS